jgi:hypothetical protein
VQRTARDVLPIEPEDVEHVVVGAAMPVDFAIEDHLAHGQRQHGCVDGGMVLGQPVARQ